MNDTEFLSRLGRLSDQDQASLLLALAFQLTIAGRGAYLLNSLEVKTPRTLRGINELEHKVLSQARHLLDQSERYPIDVFAKLLFEIAEQHGCRSELEIAVDRAS